MVPAGAPIYADALIRPEGDTKAALDSALSKLLGSSDVGGAIVGRLDKSLAKSGLTYAGDIEPWLGQRAGFFLTTIQQANSDGALVVEQTDPAAATAAVEKAVRSSPHAGSLQHSSFKGVDVGTEHGNAYAVVGDFLVLGTQPAVQAAITASKGGSLADSQSYASALSPAPADRLATVWADPKGIVDALSSSGAYGKGGADFSRMLSSAAGQPIAGWAEATSDHLALELSTASSGATSGSSLITGFPDDAWLAFGASGFGQGLAKGLDQLRSLPSGALGGTDPAAALGQFRALTGVDLANIGSWLGDVSGYLSGSEVFSLGGALVLSSHDQAASARSLAQIQAALSHVSGLLVNPLGGGQTGFSIVPSTAPIEIDVAQRGGKVVAGLGAGSVDRALSPPSSLGDSATFKAATSSLGSEIVPSFYLDFQPIAGLLSLPGVSTDPNLERVKPYLDRLDYVIAGAGSAGGRKMVRIVLGVRAGASSGSSSGVAASLALP